MFHFFTSHVAKNTWKTQIRVILCFLVGKRGVSSRGKPHLDPFGVSTGTPAFDPPFSNLKTQIIAHLVFPTVFRNCYWKKVKQNTIPAYSSFFQSFYYIVASWFTGQFDTWEGFCRVWFAQYYSRQRTRAENGPNASLSSTFSWDDVEGVHQFLKS